MWKHTVVFGEFRFFILDVTDETSIGHFFAPRYRRFLFEVNVVGAVDLFANTLCESSEFIGEGFFQVSFSSPFMRWRYSWA